MYYRKKRFGYRRPRRKNFGYGRRGMAYRARRYRRYRRRYW